MVFFKYFICKHWWEVIYKPFIFVFAYIFAGILFSAFLIHGFGVDPEAFRMDGYDVIYFVPIVVIYCLCTYIRSLKKR